MTHCKPLFLGTVLAGLVCAAPVYAQQFDFEGIDTLLADNMLEEAANRYSSVLLSFRPEEATRRGISSSYDKLNARTPQQSAQMLAALRSVKTALDALQEKTLSDSKQADRELLLLAVEDAIWQEEQNRFRTDPLYYAQALDAIYDLVTKELSPAPRQQRELAARLQALSAVADQAEQYLTAAAPFTARLAMEKAYHAYLSADTWTEILTRGVQDEDALNQAQRTAAQAKQSVKRLFDTFKTLSQQETWQDFRLGEENYRHVLRTRYQWPEQKTAAFLKGLEKNLQTAQHNLTQTLDPFMQGDDEQEVTVMAESNLPATEQTAPTRPAKKKKSKEISPRNAQDFYAAAKAFLTAEADETPLQTLQTDAARALSLFIEKGLLPNRKVTFSFAQLPPYYAYTQAYLMLPPFGNQANPKADFLLRIPSGNTLTRQEQFNQDFNAPTRKLMISGEVVPGRLYQAQSTLQNSSIRRLYPSASLQNGWAVYAKRLAKEKGYISLDEELMFLAWDEYQHALAAWVDAQLHTHRYSYTEAMDFLTQTHGLTEEQATDLIKQVTAHPGEAVSYLIGLDALENAHRTFSKKYGKKFNEADFNAKLFQIGNVSPARLEKELARLYKRDKEMKKIKSAF